MDRVYASRIAAGGAALAAGVAVSYALYFDYRRRHDAVFRKQLAQKNQVVQKKAQQGQADTLAVLKRAVALIRAESYDLGEREQYFMEQVGLGEMAITQGPEYYVAAALAFFRALKSYPAPQDLLGIYRGTQPPAVFALVMELIRLDLMPSPTDPRDVTSGAILTEIDPAAASNGLADPPEQVL
ncbi:hypothetical protein RQP46_003794 [Phenoliferia psychrophenolica]